MLLIWGTNILAEWKKRRFDASISLRSEQREYLIMLLCRALRGLSTNVETGSRNTSIEDDIRLTRCASFFANNCMLTAIMTHIVTFAKAFVYSV
jgi:(p)ppGpp synthase/HD superfamily hydrolase